MKKKAIIALVVAALVALQAPMVALAATDYHGEKLIKPFTCDGEESNNIGSIEIKDDNATAITASSGGKVQVNGSVINEDGTAIIASGTGTSVTIGGNARCNDAAKAKVVVVESGAEVNVSGDCGNGYGSSVTGSGSKLTIGGEATSVNSTAIFASGSGEAKIGGDAVSVHGAAVKAESGGKVTAQNAFSGLAGVYAKGKGTEVIINGDVKSTGTSANSDEYKGTGIYIGNEATVYADNVEASKYGIFVASGGTKVVCTGTVKGDMYGIYVNDPSQPYDVTVYAVESQGKALSFEMLRDEVKYIVKDSDGSATYKNMTIEGCETVTTPDGKTYFTSKEGTITVTVADGYKLSGTTSITGSGNVYTVTIPYGGGVTLEAIIAAVEQAAGSSNGNSSYWSPEPMKKGSASAPLSSGSWKPINGNFQYVFDGEPLRNSLAVITYIPAGQTQPVTGTYYFDKYGNMAIGWKLINGVWYYFNTVAGATQGALLTNTITPDGYKVGADGAWIQ